MDPSSSALSKSNLSLSMGLSTLPLRHMATKKWQGRIRSENSEEDVSKEQGHSTGSTGLPIYPPSRIRTLSCSKATLPPQNGYPSYDALTSAA